MVGAVMLALPNGATWSGKLGDLLRVLNSTWNEKLNAMVKQVDELEKHGDKAALQKAANEVDLQIALN